ncbi:hypothetical protein [Nocardioides jejuensis]|nr:hypothetical protein [Nocardioides jejuensis]
MRSLSTTATVTPCPRTTTSPDVVEATYRAMIAAFIELELVEHSR